MIEAFENISKEQLHLLVKKQNSLLVEKESIITDLQFQIEQFKRLLFGTKRERFIAASNPEQLTLPLEADQEKITEVIIEKIAYTRQKVTKEKHPGRLPLPSHLPVEEIIIEPQENTEGLKCIGKEITDELELIPAKLFIKRYIRPKYIKSSDDEKTLILIGKLPSRPIGKCIAGVGLLSQILIDKYVDHLPIYRQLKRFEREGVKIPSSTIDSWQGLTSTLLEPLYECLKQFILAEGYLQVDETPTRVLDKTKKGESHQGYHWVYHAPIQKAVFFDYQKGRGRDGPKELLKDFKGYLQTDGYQVYNWFGKQQNITHVGCLAHARRYFEKALNYNKSASEYVLTEIQKLYAIERKAREENFSAEQRHQLRLDESLPILNELGKWLAERAKTELPKSPMGIAIHYIIGRWDNMLAYLKDGLLEIDNNLIENAIRPNALGRKNYLFAGSHQAAQRIAMFYSFFGTCQKNNIDPYKWLKHVLQELPDYPASKIKDLLPQFIKL
jgi:transposase